MMRRLFLLIALFLTNSVLAQTPPVDLGDTGDATLSWDCDTCAMDDVTGFKIYYGSASRSNTLEPVDYSTPAPYDTLVTIVGGDARSYQFSGLTPGVYYFRVTALDNEKGTESVFSNEASEVVGIPPVDFLSCVYGGSPPPPTPVSFSHVQNAGAVNVDPASVTLAAAPTNGNLLVAAAMERGGGSADDFTITGTGWTKRVARTVQQGNATYRRSMAVWTKVAGAAEPATITIDDGTSNTKTGFVVEYSHGSGSAAWTFEAVASNDNGAVTGGTSLATGTTGVVPAGDLLLIGIAALKRSNTGESWTATWTSNLTSRVSYEDSVAFGRQLILSDYFLDTSSGAKSSTATFSGGDIGNNTGLINSILVFSASEGGAASMPPPIFTPTMRRYQHLVVR